MVPLKVQVNQGILDVLVAEQLLNGEKIDALF